MKDVGGENESGEDSVDRILFDMLSLRSRDIEDEEFICIGLELRFVVGIGVPFVRPEGLAERDPARGEVPKGDSPTRSEVSMPRRLRKSKSSDRKTSFNLRSRVKAISADATRERR